MGIAENWQAKVEKVLKEPNMITDILVYNPRRDDWDSSWIQEPSNPQFNVQVNWELDMIDAADFIFMHFDPATKSPITLMELGYIASKFNKKLIVSCPDGFWRKGNVDILCNRVGVYVHPTLESALSALSFEII